MNLCLLVENCPETLCVELLLVNVSRLLCLLKCSSPVRNRPALSHPPRLQSQFDGTLYSEDGTGKEGSRYLPRRSLKDADL